MKKITDITYDTNNNKTDTYRSPCPSPPVSSAFHHHGLSGDGGRGGWGWDRFRTVLRPARALRVRHCVHIAVSIFFDDYLGIFQLNDASHVPCLLALFATCWRRTLQTHNNSELSSVLLDCIECMRCGLLWSMCPASVSQSVCLYVTRAGCAKTAKRINIRFGVKTPGNPRNIVFDKTTWVRCGLCQITLDTCFIDDIRKLAKQWDTVPESIHQSSTAHKADPDNVQCWLARCQVHTWRHQLHLPHHIDSWRSVVSLPHRMSPNTAIISTCQ